MMTGHCSVHAGVAGALLLLTCGPVAAQSSILASQPDAAKPTDLRSVPAEATAAAVANPEWQVPRTSWGHPSLGGVWSSDDMRSVPMTRAPQFGRRESLTEQEFYDRASRDQGAHDDPENAASFLQHEYGIRTFGYTSMIIDPPDGKMPALTAAGEAALAARTAGTYGAGPFNSFEDFTLYDRCVTRGPIGSVLPAIYGNGVQIVQGPDMLAVTSEMIHETRVVHLEDVAPFDEIRQFSGSARGHWEDDTLVVESVGYTDRASVSRAPNSTEFKLTERFTRVDPEMIEYVATVEDPVSLTAPFTFRLMLTTQPDYAVYEYNCHEGNQAVRNALAGERVYEQQVAEALANGQPIPARATEHTQIRNGAPEVLFNINAGE